MDPLAFRCTGCGNCCRSLRVAVTAQDVVRLMRATNLPARELVEWLGPDDVDMRGEPASFVELREGRRLMVLAQRDDACVLLDANERCRAYAARPRDCRAYPFDFEKTNDGRHRLTLLPNEGCDYGDDGQNDEQILAQEDAERWQELEAYQAIVEAWNRKVWHRRRLRRSVGRAEDFLAQLEAGDPPVLP